MHRLAFLPVIPPSLSSYDYWTPIYMSESNWTSPLSSFHAVYIFILCTFLCSVSMCHSPTWSSTVFVYPSFSTRCSFTYSLNTVTESPLHVRHHLRHEGSLNSQWDQQHWDHGEGDNQTLDFLPSSPSRAVFQRSIWCRCAEHRLHTHLAKQIHVGAVSQIRTVCASPHRKGAVGGP